MNYLSKIDKVVYSTSSNDYKIYFVSDKCKMESFFHIPVSDAKNIVLAKENIYSDKLKTYDFIIDLLFMLSMKIDRFIIVKNNNKVAANLYFKLNKIQYKINLSFIDAIILSIKTFSNIYIHKDLYYDTHAVKLLNNQNIKSKDKIDNLKNILKLLIENEKYESAALLRNKINKMNN